MSRTQLLDHGISEINHLEPACYYKALVDHAFSSPLLLRTRADAADGDEAILLPKASRGQAAARAARFRFEKSFKWGCISFIGKRVQSGSGLQVDCPRRSHHKRLPSGGWSKCQFSPSFHSPEERELVSRRAKWWVLQAWNCKARARHGTLRKALPADADLPSMQAVDRQVPVPHVDTEEEGDGPTPARKVRRRARPKEQATPESKQATSSSSSSSSGVGRAAPVPLIPIPAGIRTQARRSSDSFSSRSTT